MENKNISVPQDRLERLNDNGVPGMGAWAEMRL